MNEVESIKNLMKLVGNLLEGTTEDLAEEVEDLYGNSILSENYGTFEELLETFKLRGLEVPEFGMEGDFLVLYIDGLLRYSKARSWDFVSDIETLKYILFVRPSIGIKVITHIVEYYRDMLEGFYEDAPYNVDNIIEDFESIFVELDVDFVRRVKNIVNNHVRDALDIYREETLDERLQEFANEYHLDFVGREYFIISQENFLTYIAHVEKHNTFGDINLNSKLSFGDFEEYFDFDALSEDISENI